MKLEVDIKKNLRDFVLAAKFTTRDEVFALLGASGCGKSMTLKCIAGIEKPDEGKIILNGRTLFDSEQKINLPPQARRVGYLFQNYALFPNMTVAENILFAAVGEREEKLRRLKENLARFQLEGLEKAYPAELSGGQQQRVAFARILTSHAEILLLDEPFSALDSHLKWQLELELAEIFKSYGNSAVLVSHDRGEVFRLANRIAVMTSGNIDVIDTKHELFRHPRTLSAALLSGCKNISSARKISEEKIFAEEWGVELTLRKKIPDDLKFVGMRSHFLEYSAELGENIFPVEVAQVIEDNFEQIIMFRAEKNSKLIRWETDKDFWKKISGGEIFLRFPAEKIILLTR